MKVKKRYREKGKLRLSEYFKKLKEGDRVAIVKEPSVKSGFHIRMRGKSGVIEGARGKAYIVRIKDNKKEKTLIMRAIHLKKLR